MSAFCTNTSLPLRRLRPYTTPKCAVSSSEDVKQSKPDPTEHEFKSWAADNDVVMNSIKLTSFSSNSEAVASRGMVATSPLKTGDLLVSLNRNRVLQVTSLDVKRSPFPEKVSNETWKKLPWYVRLALRTLECKMDTRKELHLWASLLPTSFDLPLSWSDEELEELQNPRLVAAVREQQKEYRKWYDILNKANNAIMRGVKYSDFLWAVNCVRSRAFQGPLELAPFRERLRLIIFIAANVVIWPALNALPIENALNGGLTALFALFVYDIVTPKIVKIIQGVELQRFQVRSGENYQPEDEVFISYGSQSNDAFLQYYGFIEPSNPAETFTFDASIEKMLGVPKNSLVARRGGFDKRIVDAVTRKLGGNRKAAETTLRELCQAELNAMVTTLEEDEAVIQKGQFRSSRQELAIRYRIEKKKLMQSIAFSQ